MEETTTTTAGEPRYSVAESVLNEMLAVISNHVTGLTYVQLTALINKIRNDAKEITTCKCQETA